MTIQQKMFQELHERTVFDKARQYAYAYADEMSERHVYPTDEALVSLSQFDEELPALPLEGTEVIEQLHKYGSPATVAQTGGRYFGFVNGGVVPTGLAAKWLADFWDQNTAMQVISPISSKLEVVVERWLRELFQLPDRTAAGFVSGSFAATFCGLAAARYRLLERLEWDVNRQGLSAAPIIRIVTSRQAHSTVLKAIGLLGFGQDNIEWVDVDDQGRIITDRMPQFDARTIVILQAGNVNSGCYEDFESICQLAVKAGAWVHIDGAFGLWVGAVETLRHLTKGIELANSWAVDGHKTLNTPYDCGIVLCEDREALVAALHMSGAYIVLGTDRDGMFYTPEMSRRARIIELWAVMKSLGRQGMDEMILGLHHRAVQFAQELTAAGFTILNEVVFNQVLVYYHTDEITMKVLDTVQRMSVCWCGGSVWEGKRVIRISVCSWATTVEDVRRSVASFVLARNRHYSGGL